MKAVVGLGNPGRKFKDTRHNVGFKVIDELASSAHLVLKGRAHTCLFGRGNIDGEKVILAKPLTYVNRSGEPIKSLVRYYRIPFPDLLVIYDDADLELGHIRIRSKGSSGGHQGMESIISSLGSTDFPRVRIGIRGKGRPQELADYVLTNFNKKEKAVISEVVARAAEAVKFILREGITKAMNEYN
ncbi:aminoacyl-tRNA hydrolase [bacterium]|nr:aminoacyl-tRNA hydrolase [bacterium]MCK4325448.1 aminoacyl-tRNA hydrolase [bacterium]